MNSNINSTHQRNTYTVTTIATIKAPFMTVQYTLELFCSVGYFNGDQQRKPITPRPIQEFIWQNDCATLLVPGAGNIKKLLFIK